MRHALRLASDPPGPEGQRHTAATASTDAARFELCDAPRMRLAWVMAFVLTGCIDTDAAVFLDATLESPALEVSASSLATGLSGSTTLSLHLGPRAAGSSTAKVVTLSLVSADGATTLAPTLGFTSTPALPVTVNVDDTVSVALALAASDNPLQTDAAAALCAGSIRFRAVIDDSLRGGSVTSESDAFAATGCP